MSHLRKTNPNLVYGKACDLIFNLSSVCDPAIGDNGKLYPSITDTMVEEYRAKVLKEVDYLLPNQTECQ